MLQFLAKGRSKEQLKFDKRYQRKFQEAMTLSTFGITVCLDQQIRGEFYMFEHPWNAMSWKQDVIQRVLRLPSTYVARTDQCCFGLIDLDHNPIRKRTGIMTNSRNVEQLPELARKNVFIINIALEQVKVSPEQLQPPGTPTKW